MMRNVRVEVRRGSPHLSPLKKAGFKSPQRALGLPPGDSSGAVESPRLPGADLNSNPRLLAWLRASKHVPGASGLDFPSCQMGRPSEPFPG